MKKQANKVNITDRNGKVISIKKPLFGILKIIHENGRTIITKAGWFSSERTTIPSIEDRIDINI